MSNSFNNSDNQKWEIINLGNGHYRIRNYANNRYLHNSDEQYINDCKGRYTINSDFVATHRQEWKIVPNGNGSYSIINAYTRAYLHNSIQMAPNTSDNHIINYPNINDSNYRKWWISKIEPITDPSLPLLKKNSKDKISIFPNPAKDIINLTYSTMDNKKEILLMDTKGRILSRTTMNKKNTQINISHLTKGLYFVQTNINGETKLLKKIIKL